MDKSWTGAGIFGRSDASFTNYSRPNACFTAPTLLRRSPLSSAASRTGAFCLLTRRKLRSGFPSVSAKRCQRRLHDIADARLDIEDALALPSSATSQSRSPKGFGCLALDDRGTCERDLSYRRLPVLAGSTASRQTYHSSIVSPHGWTVWAAAEQRYHRMESSWFFRHSIVSASRRFGFGPLRPARCSRCPQLMGDIFRSGLPIAARLVFLPMRS